MGLLMGKIVLTGGPCAGKTTALTRIEESLAERGYRVFVVSESATELIKGGIRPFGSCAIELFKFQELILKYQLSKESIYEEAIRSLPKNEKCVIIYDRGILDNRAYIGRRNFAKLLKMLNLKELSLMDNYDMVIHMVTAADGKQEFYTLDNNSARTESVEDAIKLDKKTINAWVGHNNLRIIDNSTNFEEKLNRVLDCVHNLLGNPIYTRKQRKFRVQLSSLNFQFLNSDECVKIDIEQTYLHTEKENPNYEKRLRKRTLNGENTYYFTIQKKEPNGVSRVVTDKKITEKEYFKLLSMYKDKRTIKKTRYTFANEKQYYKLDVYHNYDDLVLLEVEQLQDNDEIKFPNNLHIIEEVTNDDDYLNSTLSDTISIRKGKMKKIKKA